jgi:6-pyruvoyl-tetrahydropterin synthase related domain
MSPFVRAVRHPNVVLVAVVGVALCYALTTVDWFDSHEGASYVVRTVEWAAGMQAGQIYPRWSPDLYGGYGSPFFVFYAPAVYATAAALAAVGFDPVTALKIVIALASVASGLGMYALVIGETRRSDAALLAALLYLAAPYRLADLYWRGDLAEFVCLAIVPVALALYRATAFSLSPSRTAAAATGAAAAHALAILCHTLLGLWSTLLLALVLIATGYDLARRHAWRRVAVLAASFTAALTLSAVYVLPALIYRNLVRIDAMSAAYFDPRNNWLSIGRLFARDTFQVGPLVVAAAGLTLAAALRDRTAGRRAAVWLAGALGLVLLTLPQATSLWTPGRIPFGALIQFPWRLLGPASLLSAVAAGVAWQAVVQRSSPWRSSMALALGGIALLLLAWPRVTVTPFLRATIPRDPAAIRRAMISTTVVDEYLPRTAPRAPLHPRDSLLAASHDVELQDFWSDAGWQVLSLHAKRAGASAVVASHQFPGWQIETVGGASAAAALTSEDGLLAIRLPAPGSYVVRLRYDGTAASTVGAALSLAAALLMYPLLRRLAWPPCGRRLAAHGQGPQESGP